MDGVAGLHGWQWLFLIEGALAFLLSFAVLVFLPDGPARASWLTVGDKELIIKRLASEEPPGRRDLWRALYDPRLLALSLANFAFQASAYGVGLWLPQIVQGMGFSNRDTGFVVALPYVVSLGAMIICGRSSSKRGERIWHVALPWLLAGSGFAVASLVQSNTIVLAALSFGLIIMYAAYGPFFSLPSSFLRGTAAAGGIGLFNMIGSLGGFFGPTLIGALREGSGDYATGLAAVAFGFVLAALIVLAAGRMMAPRPVIAMPEMDGAG
jgi:ACS family tartrate transporter-like MFS transporter